MTSNNGRSRRTQGILAGVAGAALLLGGGTYALWTANDTITGGKITAGDLNIEAGTFAAFDVSADREDAKTDVITGVANFTGHSVDLTSGTNAEWRIVPGDTVALVFPFKATVKGDNLVAALTMNTKAVLASKDFSDVAGQLEFKYRLFAGTTEITKTGAIALPEDTDAIATIASNDLDMGGGAADTTKVDVVVDKAGATINTTQLTYVLLVTFKSTAADRDNVNEVADLAGALSATLTQIRTAGVGQFK